MPFLSVADLFFQVNEDKKFYVGFVCMVILTYAVILTACQ